MQYHQDQASKEQRDKYLNIRVNPHIREKDMSDVSSDLTYVVNR